MRVVFMGTPDFSLVTLKALIDSEHEILAVVTKPDAASGRGKKIQISPVKKMALEHNIRIFQPKKVRDEEFINIMREINPDIIVVVAFGQIIPKEILDIPKYHCINVHASLLPKYRGAGPIQRAILNGDEFTGITTMLMDVGLDTGDMLLKKELKILESDTGGSLFERLSEISGNLLLDTIKALEDRSIEPIKQDEDLATYAPMLKKTDGIIDFTLAPKEISNMVRALSPWPSAFTYINSKMLKIWKLDYVEDKSINNPFEIIEIEKDYFSVGCNGGYIKVYEVQLQGKKRMPTSEFLKGFDLKKTDVFTRTQK